MILMINGRSRKEGRGKRESGEEEEQIGGDGGGDEKSKLELLFLAPFL